jgi:DNA-3-methyladenine glycosylase
VKARVNRRDIILPRLFYQRDALEVARDLIGKRLRHGGVTLRITETEAYRWPDDTASHGRTGRTRRNAPMWGAGGHAYVYLCYGLHQMLNVVTNPEGEASAVLVRACEPIDGLELIQARRNMQSAGPELLAGPGRVAAALAVDTTFSGHPLFERGGLELLDGPPPAALLHGPRVGIDYARADHKAAAWRIAAADTVWVSRRRELRPMRQRSTNPGKSRAAG